METKERLIAAIALFDAEVQDAADNIGLQSACTEWTIGELIRHVVHVQRELTLRLLAGQEPGRMQGMIDVNDYAAVQEWDAVRDELRAALESADADQITNRFTLPALDMTLHAWDVRGGLVHVGLTEPLEFDSRTLTWLDAFKKHAPEELIRKPAMFAAEEPVSDDASPTARYMAWAGRPQPFASVE
ncbi:DinB family protein [Agrococcus casei]|uniref:DinB family protein n=1 Tax=Agrococcus casei TaxID=343512 RepID=UPI003F9860FE